MAVTKQQLRTLKFHAYSDKAFRSALLNPKTAQATAKKLGIKLSKTDVGLLCERADKIKKESKRHGPGARIFFFPLPALQATKK